MRTHRPAASATRARPRRRRCPRRRSTSATAWWRPGAFNGKPYWLALAQCGGAYFELNVCYTDIATRARVKPDPKTATEYTKKLTDEIKIGTMYFNGAERFLMADRGVERVDAVLTYDPQSRAAGDRLKTVDPRLPLLLPVPRSMKPAKWPIPRPAASAFRRRARRS